MGLPHVPSGRTNEERLAKLRLHTQNYAHCSSVSTFSVGGLCVEHVSISPGNLGISSAKEFSNNRKEGAGTSDASFKPRRNRDILPYVPKVKFGSEDSGCWNAKQEVDDVTSVSRIVGFQANEATICCGQLNNSCSSDEVDLTVSDTGSCGSEVPKRMLSPLSQLNLPDNCRHDVLNHGSGMQTPVKTEKACNVRTKDLRKPYDGSNDQLSTPISSVSYCKECINASYECRRKASYFLIDGPSQDSSDVFFHPLLDFATWKTQAYQEVMLGIRPPILFHHLL